MRSGAHARATKCPCTPKKVGAEVSEDRRSQRSPCPNREGGWERAQRGKEIGVSHGTRVHFMAGAVESMATFRLRRAHLPASWRW